MTSQVNLSWEALAKPASSVSKATTVPAPTPQCTTLAPLLQASAPLVTTVEVGLLRRRPVKQNSTLSINSQAPACPALPALTAREVPISRVAIRATIVNLSRMWQHPLMVSWATFAQSTTSVKAVKVHLGSVTMVLYSQTRASRVATLATMVISARTVEC